MNVPQTIRVAGELYRLSIADHLDDMYFGAGRINKKLKSLVAMAKKYGFKNAKISAQADTDSDATIFLGEGKKGEYHLDIHVLGGYSLTLNKGGTTTWLVDGVEDLHKVMREAMKLLAKKAMS